MSKRRILATIACIVVAAGPAFGQYGILQPRTFPDEQRYYLIMKPVFEALDRGMATRYRTLNLGSGAGRVGTRLPGSKYDYSDPWVFRMYQASASQDSTETEILFAKALQVAAWDRDRVITMETLGRRRLEQGRIPAAEQAMREALALNKKRLGPDDADLSRSLWDLADILEVAGKNDEAETNLRLAIVLCEEKFGLRDGRTGECYRKLGELREKQNRIAEADSLYGHALTLQEKKWGRNDRKTLKALDDLGRISAMQHKLVEAAGLFERSVAILEHARKSWENDLQLARALNNLGRVRTLQGRLDEAQSCLARAYGVLRPADATNETRVALENYAAVLEQRGRKGSADSLRSEADRHLMRALGVR